MRPGPEGLFGGLLLLRGLKAPPPSKMIQGSCRTVMDGLAVILPLRAPHSFVILNAVKDLHLLFVNSA